jgi:hypothetical protein
MIPRTAESTPGAAVPAATAALQACEAWSMSVLFGGGALLEFCASASQQRFKLGPGTPALVCEAEGATEGGGSGVRVGAGGGGAVVAGGAGSGGGGSSFGQPLSDSSVVRSASAAAALTPSSIVCTAALCITRLLY